MVIEKERERILEIKDKEELMLISDGGDSYVVPIGTN